MPEAKPHVYKVKDLARLLDCPFEGDGEVEVGGVADLKNAGPADLAFLSQVRMQPLLEKTRAAAVILPPELPLARIPVLRSTNPQRTFIKAVELFWQPYRPEPGVHPLAVLSPSARLGRDVSIGALSVIGDEAEVGDETVVFPLVSIYPRARVGRRCILHSHVSLREGVVLGDRVTLHNGVVVGSDGFGYLQADDRSHIKIPQKGTVILEDDVEVGAHTTIDRATLGETIIRRGTKIDNLVMVAHNVEVGPDSILISQVGIAGSSKVGARVILSGQVGISDHVVVGDDVIVTAQSGVYKDIPSNSIVGGSPPLDIREARKFWTSIPHLHELIKEVKRLRIRVVELEKKQQGKS